MNNNTIEKLQYRELKEKVKEYCVSGLGKNLIEKLEPSNSIKTVERRLNETTEGRRLLDAGYIMPLEGIFNVLPLMDKMEKGASLEPAELNMMGDFFRGCRKVKEFVKNKEGYAPVLTSYGVNITDFKYIEEEINRSIRGSIVDSNASKELKKIRRNIEINQDKIKERLDKFIKNAINREYIQEAFISQRNGRFTIPIKASFKNQVQGVVIETSSSGATVFMEPSVISRYSEELNTLRLEESIEEYKILGALTEMIYEKIHEVKINIEVIAEYDMIMAKAKYSREINGINPKLNSHGFIKIINGKYPLMKKPVPLNFNIGEDFRSLIITGPNAGGKTVVLKTIGLLTMAVYSGFHIEAAEGTEIAIFDNIFVDIGDNQSIENALSTFSSHVKNLSDIFKESTKNSLLLFDEIGSGTEPNEGAALAIAILEEFYQKGCITVATTHYGEIKNFSHNHPDFENAAMEFKVDTLEPLYKLKIGQSGESNALYIARKMGINERILERTARYIASKEYNYDILKESKITKEKISVQDRNQYSYKQGDKVLLLDYGLSAIVYKEIDRLNNIEVLFNGEFISVNYKRVKLEIPAEELYPDGYDMNQLFVSFKDRKLERDIERGSKKALKKIRKEFNR